MKLSDLETPCLVLDKGKMKNNISKINKHLKRLGVNLRPHGKTAKNIDIIQMSLEGQFGGITASTLKEAEFYFDNGIKDIIYAVGIASVKLERVVKLIKKGANLAILLDSIEQANFIISKAVQHNITIPVYIEFDCGGNRAGVRPDDPILIEIGYLLNNNAGVTLQGVLTHAGQAYKCKTVDDIRSVANEERDAGVKCAEVLRQNGLPCPVVSIGSTPTALFADDLNGVTEVRAGVYMFHDLVMAGLGVCDVTDIAISVLCSIIGHQKYKDWLLTDAGWMALSRDRSTASHRVDQGYGLICNIQGDPYRELILSETNQEHGIIAHRDGKDFDWQPFSIGNMVRILPNHACATAAMHDRYYVVDGTTEVVDVWQRINGW